MKATTDYIELLKQYKALNAEKYGIKRMGIFGSVARGEQKENSDIDVYVEIDTPTLFKMVDIKDELQYLLGCKVDLIRLRGTMDYLLRNQIEKEGVYV